MFIKSVTQCIQKINKKGKKFLQSVLRYDIM